MNSSEHDPQSALPTENSDPENVSAEGAEDGLPAEPDPSMSEYFRLQRELLVITLLLTAIGFASTLIFYSLNTSLNYFLGACAGLLYLRLLSKHVEQLGRQRKKLGQTRLAVFIVLILAASRLNQLEILPIFLGFLTYKAGLIVYVLRTALIPESK